MEVVKDINGKKFQDFAIEFMKTYSTYTEDERLDALMSYIPYVIENFQDCTSEEEYRMKAKQKDQTLATIQVMHKDSGWKLYKPIPIQNANEYKKFYFQTLVFSLVQYVMFFQGTKFDILENDNKVGELSITEEQLPHLLGLENKLVSNKDCEKLEEIIKGYNSLSILDKILAIVENQDEIIKWEEEKGGDLFNYFKNMQKNKEFLLLGRIFAKDEQFDQDYNRVFLLRNRTNQLFLYKKSNMNQTMQRSISKMIIQKGLDDVYFPRSLQAVTEQILHTSEFMDLMQQRPGMVEVDGIEALVSSDGYNIDVQVPSLNQRLAQKYMWKILTPPPGTESEPEEHKPHESTYYSIVKNVFDVANIEETVLDDYKEENNQPVHTKARREIINDYETQRLLSELTNQEGEQTEEDAWFTKLMLEIIYRRDEAQEIAGQTWEMMHSGQLIETSNSSKEENESSPRKK